MRLKIFLAETIGTFGLVVAAAGSIVYDGRVGGILGLGFIAAMHFVGLAILIFVFGKYSMAHFNPAVTIGFWIAGYVRARYIPVYFCAQLIGAFTASLAILYLIGNYADLGSTLPGSGYAVFTAYGVEVLATVFLMGAILFAVGSQRGPVLTCVVIAAAVALDVYFLGPISGASMNPVRSLAPALVAGNTVELWIYLTAPFIGAVAVAAVFRRVLGRHARHVI